MTVLQTVLTKVLSNLQNYPGPLVQSCLVSCVANTGISLADHYFQDIGSTLLQTSCLFFLKNIFTIVTTFSYKISPYHIEGWTFSNWWETKMGASSSSASATGENAKNSEQSMNNFGLVNMADTGDNGSSFTFNLVEVLTCVVAVLMGIFLLRYCCIKKRQQNLLRMQRNVQEAVQVVVAPHAARLPVLSGPPPSAHPPTQPAYPLQELPPYSAQKTTPEQIGAAVMKNYM